MYCQNPRPLRENPDGGSPVATFHDATSSNSHFEWISLVEEGSGYPNENEAESVLDRDYRPGQRHCIRARPADRNPGRGVVVYGRGGGWAGDRDAGAVAASLAPVESFDSIL